MIRTGRLLADLAKSVGYELVGIDLFRTRLATATKEQLREEVVILRWPGSTQVNDWPQQNDGSAMALKDEPPETTMKAPRSPKPSKKANRYSAIIERLFFSKYEKGMREVPFESGENGVTIASEKHYKLVPPKEVTHADLQTYRGRFETPA